MKSAKMITQLGRPKSVTVSRPGKEGRKAAEKKTRQIDRMAAAAEVTISILSSVAYREPFATVSSLVVLYTVSTLLIYQTYEACGGKCSKNNRQANTSLVKRNI